MKNMFLTIALLFTSFATQARSLEYAPVIATVSGYEEGIQQVSLLADGRLQVAYSVYVGDTYAGETRYKTFQVSEAVLKRLKSTVIYLSEVEVKESKSNIVCKMMPIPSLSNLHLNYFNHNTQKFGQKLNLILTGQGCELSYKVAPVSPYQLNAAQLLREQLVILALNAK